MIFWYLNNTVIFKVVILILSFFSYAGNYFLGDDTTVIVLRDHIFRAGEHGQYYPVWTFNATSYYKIRFHFTEYDCSRLSSSYCWVKIGNGLASGENQFLHHYGRTEPSDPVSESNTAWLQARASYIFQNMTTCSIVKLIYRKWLFYFDKVNYFCLDYTWSMRTFISIVC